MSKQQKDGGKESKKGQRSEGKGKGQRKATSRAGLQLKMCEARQSHFKVHIFTHAGSLPISFLLFLMTSFYHFVDLADNFKVSMRLIKWYFSLKCVGIKHFNEEKEK